MDGSIPVTYKVDAKDVITAERFGFPNLAFLR
jgi:hypothetical protein